MVIADDNLDPNSGRRMHDLATELFPICRSITGEGVRQTLRRIQKEIPLDILEVPSGTEVFDWTVPAEWNIREAYVIGPDGDRIVDFRNNNLHVMGYSEPVDRTVSLAELDAHLYSLPEQPNAIPYVTSYYKRRWGFCLRHETREQLKPGDYKVYIDSDYSKGSLTYGECILPGESEQEVFFSTYICHPSMANNELSGPVVATELARWLATQSPRYTYRFVFVPETIGSITYLSQRLAHLQQRVIAGFNLTCIGDDRHYSYIPSRYGTSYADRIVKNVCANHYPDHRAYTFLDRGSDERQYCSPGVDLPLVTLMRTRFGDYPEYHTSLDDLDLVTPTGLMGGLRFAARCALAIEHNNTYVVQTKCEPQLGKRGLYPDLSKTGSNRDVQLLENFLAYADGNNDLIDIGNRIGASVSDLAPIVGKLLDANLVRVRSV